MNMDDRFGGSGMRSQAVTNEVSLSEDMGMFHASAVSGGMEGQLDPGLR